MSNALCGRAQKGYALVHQVQAEDYYVKEDLAAEGITEAEFRLANDIVCTLPLSAPIAGCTTPLAGKQGPLGPQLPHVAASKQELALPDPAGSLQPCSAAVSNAHSSRQLQLCCMSYVSMQRRVTYPLDWRVCSAADSACANTAVAERLCGCAVCHPILTTQTLAFQPPRKSFAFQAPGYCEKSRGCARADRRIHVHL